MKRNVLKKLFAQRGESIGETLVALLISALALMMLAGAVSSALRMVDKSKKVMDDYYTVNNALAARNSTGLDESLVLSEGTLSFLPSGLVPLSTCEAASWTNGQLSIPVISYQFVTPTPRPET